MAILYRRERLILHRLVLRAILEVRTIHKLGIYDWYVLAGLQLGTLERQLMTVQSLSAFLDLPRVTVRRHVLRLKKLGLIEPNAKGTYSVPDRVMHLRDKHVQRLLGGISRAIDEIDAIQKSSTLNSFGRVAAKS